MSVSMLFWICFLKSIVLGIMYKLGWLRSPEQVHRDRAEEQAVLRAYREWRKTRASGSAKHPAISAPNQFIPERYRKIGSVK